MIYLDNDATTYPKPKSVIKTVKKSMRRFGANPGRSGYKMAVDTAEAVYNSREALKDFFGAQGAENIVFTQNCTAALNTCIKGLAEKGGNFVCSSLEHNAVIRPLEKLKLDGVCDYIIADTDINNDDITVNNFDKAVNDKTLAVIITAASNVFGFVLPIKRISQICKKRGIPLIVDAAQAAGIIPINVGELGIDFLCVAAHKGLYAPTGLGVLVINSDILPDTLAEGGTGSNSLSPLQPDFLPDRFESGTPATASIISVKESLKMINRIGLGEIYSHEYLLMKNLEDGLREMNKVRLYTSFSSSQRLAPVLSFNVKGYSSEQTASVLAEKGICVRAGYHCSLLAHKTFDTLETGTVRVSPSIYTKKSDINLLLNCIYKL